MGLRPWIVLREFPGIAGVKRAYVEASAGGCAMEQGLPGGPARVATAPGRVNLMGDHTDYNDGFALPAAIGLSCTVRFTPRRDGRIGGASDAEPDNGRISLPADGRVGLGAGRELGAAREGWPALVASVAAALDRRGRPADGVTADGKTHVPLGGRPLSPAALEGGVG